MQTDMFFYRHFGLSSSPFEMVGQPRTLYMSKSHREALAALEWGLMHEPGNFTLLMGEVGTGKTTLINVVLGRNYDHARIAYIVNPTLGFEEMLRVVLEQLGYLPSAVTKLELLRKFEWVFEQLRPKERIAIIVDEAQVMSNETLEELRLFSNYGRNSKGHLEIMLVGQPELLDRLMAPELRQFHQRIGARAVLNPLSREEAFEYIDQKVRDAGGVTSNLFSKQALNEIVDHSQGIPRQLNLLCNNALLRAFAAGLRRVTVENVRATVGEYENLGRTAEKFKSPTVHWVRHAIAESAVVKLGGIALAILIILLSVNLLRKTRENPAPAAMKEHPSTSSLQPAANGPDQTARTLIDVNSDKLTAATKNSIPLAASVQPEKPENVVAPLPPVSVKVVADSGHAAPAKSLPYSVKAGDTLQDIAAQKLGSEKKLRSLVEANPQLRDINRIYPGETVYLPSDQ